MNKKRLIITSTISILLVTILMLGSTYSIFTSIDTDEELNVYTTGNLDITYTLDTENITFTDKIPINIEDQNTIVPYRITVENKGTVPYIFDLILEDTTSTEVINYKYIMTKVGYLEPKSLSSCTDNIIKEDIILPAGDSVDIDVRVWLSDELKNTEMTKSFFAKLKVDGIAIYDKNGTIDNSILSLRYMKKLFQYVEATDTTEEDLDYSYFRSDDYRESIKNVSFVNYIDTTNKVISWDVSDDEDGSVIAWLENNSTSGYYDLYIGAEQIIFSKDLQLFFRDLTSVDSISFDNLDTSLVTNMQHMFSKTGYNSTTFSLNLGENFNTLNVTNMRAMFEDIGYSNTGFNLTLGSNFNTSKVEDMSWMFYQTGYNSTTFTLNLGDKFDTTNVTTMVSMFNRTGYSNPTFTLNLGENFDTSNVTSMSNMFAMTGFNSTIFTLNLGEKFDTSNVEDMEWLFAYTGYSSSVFSLELGKKFDTSKVTNMGHMFTSIGYNSTTFTLDLEDKFDTSNVINMSAMFECVGWNNLTLSLKLGENFNTSKVEDMSWMFHQTGYNSTTFTLNLGDKFDTTNVTTMVSMFNRTGYSNPTFTLNLGENFDTSNVTSMSNMFAMTGFNSSSFTLNLGKYFDTSNVTNMDYLFAYTGYPNNNLVLDLSTFTFDKVTNYNYIFEGFTTTKKIYVANTTQQSWVLGKGFTNVTSDNVLIKNS